MKRILIVLSILLLAGATVSAQETMEEDVKNWKPEFTFRLYTGFTSTGPMFTGGVRVNEKRTFALFVGHGDTYLDYAPGFLYFINAGLNYRRYWHLGQRKIFAFYSDLYAGAERIYKISGKYYFYPETGEQIEVIEDNVGDVLFVGGWQPGIRVRCYKNLHLFLGPTIATNCLGLHLGIGF